MKSMKIIPTLERKREKGKKAREGKKFGKITAEEEACDDLQGKRYPIIIIKIKKIIRLTSNAGGMRRDCDSISRLQYLCYAIVGK